jgi:hypothetical protein
MPDSAGRNALALVALSVLCLLVSSCESGRNFTIANRCAEPVWVRYGNQLTEVPKEIRPGGTRSFGVVNDGHVTVSATKTRIGSLAVNSDIVLSDICPMQD